MSNVSKVFSSLLFLCFSGCSAIPDLKLLKFVPGSITQSCKLDGAWSRCIDDGFGITSTRISLTWMESALVEKIENFNSNVTCSGQNDSEISYDANSVLGTVGASMALTGATDLDLTPNGDFGCGLNQPIYTTIAFSDSCTKIFSMQSQPGCSASDRGSSLDPHPFEKQ